MTQRTIRTTGCPYPDMVMSAPMDPGLQQYIYNRATSRRQWNVLKLLCFNEHLEESLDHELSCHSQVSVRSIWLEVRHRTADDIIRRLEQRKPVASEQRLISRLSVTDDRIADRLTELGDLPTLRELTNNMNLGEAARLRATAQYARMFVPTADRSTPQVPISQIAVARILWESNNPWVDAEVLARYTLTADELAKITVERYADLGGIRGHVHLAGRVLQQLVRQPHITDEQVETFANDMQKRFAVLGKYQKSRDYTQIPLYPETETVNMTAMDRTKKALADGNTAIRTLMIAGDLPVEALRLLAQENVKRGGFGFSQRPYLNRMLLDADGNIEIIGEILAGFPPSKGLFFDPDWDMDALAKLVVERCSELGTPYPDGILMASTNHKGYASFYSLLGSGKLDYVAERMSELVNDTQRAFFDAMVEDFTGPFNDLLAVSKAADA